MMRAGAYPV
jgi:hypothetical protein